MIWTFTISLKFGGYAGESWHAVIEIDSESTLADLHDVIQEVVEFDNDHLYEFFIARTARSRDRMRFEMDYDGMNGAASELTLEDVDSMKMERKLFYLFDYGDSWLFSIRKSRKKPHEAIEELSYPRLIAEKGKKPEQYPDYDED